MFALLAWYDEPIGDLQAAVRSCSGVVDHVIAVDGRYRLFRPDSAAASPVEQSTAIQESATGIGAACTIVRPVDAWYSEGQKRTTMFRVAESLGVVFADWVIPVDADERLRCTKDLRTILESTSADRIAFRYVTPDADMPADERSVTNAGTDTRSMMLTRLLRLMPGMRVEPPTHWAFTALNREGVRGSLGKPDLTLDDFYIQHNTMTRSLQRKQHKAEYVNARNAIGET